jgi:hypothetical protein
LQKHPGCSVVVKGSTSFVVIIGEQEENYAGFGVREGRDGHNGRIIRYNHQRPQSTVFYCQLLVVSCQPVESRISAPEELGASAEAVAN